MGRARGKRDPWETAMTASWVVLGVIGTMVAAVLAIGGLAVVGVGVLVVVGLNNYGSNK